MRRDASRHAFLTCARSSDNMRESRDRPVTSAMSKLKEMLAESLWIHAPTADERRRVGQETGARSVSKGGSLCRRGEPAERWIGVVAGLATLTMASPAGKLLHAAVVPAMGWFGEGSLQKDEPRRYDAVAVRDSLVAYMPRSTFRWLVDNNIRSEEHTSE